MLNLFRHGTGHASHESSILYTESKWQHKRQQHTGRHTGTELILDFNQDYTGQISGAAGYNFLW